MTVMPLKLDVARRRLQAGGVIAYPTEAVWGIGCDPNNGMAVNKLLAIKGRDVSKGLILVAASIDQFADYLEGLERLLRAKLEHSWPGPITWLVPDNGFAPKWIVGSNSCVALRVSAHKPVVDLCRSFGGPIVSTSANHSDRPPLRWPWQLQQRLLGLDFCLHGSLGVASKPSEIRDLISDKVLRGG
ncbi:MAG: Sua5/YciO/YrdC/YwlC family protein [Pseudomonadales bacterium]